MATKAYTYHPPEPWIQTYDGRKFDLVNGKYTDIDPVTIARVLSRKCRFGGHSSVFYSVAQHSVHVSDLIEDRQNVQLRLAALLHDAHEVYSGFGDVVSPAKHLLADELHTDWLTDHESWIDKLIAARFGFREQLIGDPRIVHADRVALATEARDVMGPRPWPWMPLPEPDSGRIHPLPMEHAESLFLRRLSELWTDI